MYKILKKRMQALRNICECGMITNMAEEAGPEKTVPGDAALDRQPLMMCMVNKRK